MSDLISRSELVKVTGYEHGPKQCRVLDNFGIFHVVDKNGMPQTTWYHFNHPRHLRPGSVDAHNIGSSEPDFSSLGG